MDILRLVDRAYVVESGRVLAEGDPATLSQDPDVRRVYLGEGNSL
jgi:lipopolysaccharide export system ATP-binding protein